jgi:isoleucyl-tRNA synthetase
LIIATSDSAGLREFADVIADEVNVRNVEFTDDVSSVAAFELQVVPSIVGPRLGANTQKVIVAVKKGDWKRNGNVITAGSIDLFEGEYNLKLVPKSSGASATLNNSEGVVVLDIDLTPDLEAEGLARDLIRLIQQLRRESGLHVSDRIQLQLGLPEELAKQVTEHFATIKTETLATDIEMVENYAPNTDLDGVALFVSLNLVK